MVAIAANAFGVIAESLCYMPGYGISEAATTLAGQSLGAGRPQLMKRFGNITVVSAMAIMGAMGLVMYVLAPEIIGVMSPVEEIRGLGAGRTHVLRGYRVIRIFRGYGAYGDSERHEPCEHLGREAYLSGMACADDGA